MVAALINHSICGLEAFGRPSVGSAAYTAYHHFGFTEWCSFFDYLPRESAFERGIEGQELGGEFLFVAPAGSRVPQPV